MRPDHCPRRFAPAAVILFFAAVPASAQPNRITQALNPSRRITLAGHVPALARGEFDRGPVAAGMVMSSLSLVLAPGAARQADLDRLLAAQRDPSSPDYRRWLTPEEFALRFGVSSSDIAAITGWLAARGFHVTGVARARNRITFSGTAQQVEDAFGTSIHHYLVNGETHFSNASDPSLPAAFQGVVTSIRGLNDFRLAPRSVVRRPVALYNSSKGSHYLAPDDIAAIYDIKPLYDAGITGAGEKIAVVGQTAVTAGDIQQFRSNFGLPASDPQIVLVPNLGDPGVSKDDLIEADLDIEWTGAVARGASIVYVYSSDVTDAVQYAIDQDLAPVISMSYGSCEAQTLRSDALTLRTWAQQANAQGITWVSSAGDSGGADCATSFTNGGIATVDLPGGIPEVTGVGGTAFDDGSGTYWDSSNSSTQASALGYIPETVWNDTVTDGTPSAGGGGASTIFIKPDWQTGLGVPADGFRDVPDIAMASSADHDGYLIYTSGTLSVVGGTSAAAPVVAGIVALVNQRLASSGVPSGAGNINPALYSLAQTNPGAFHDIVSGDNKVAIACGARTRNCVSGTYGFSAGPGYDQASGLGSLDVSRLVNAYPVAAPRTVTPVIGGISNGASFLPAFAPGGILSVFGTGLASATAAASGLPLPYLLAGASATINGIAAPLYYVSPGQINLQIPDSLAPGPVTLVVANGTQSASSLFDLAASAPGIFASVVPASAARGDILAIYLTGTGNAANLSSLAVAVGGVAAVVRYAGVPSWSVGVVQVNFQVPFNAPTGARSLIVTVAGASSQAVGLTVR